MFSECGPSGPGVSHHVRATKGRHAFAQTKLKGFSKPSGHSPRRAITRRYQRKLSFGMRSSVP